MISEIIRKSQKTILRNSSTQYQPDWVLLNQYELTTNNNSLKESFNLKRYRLCLTISAHR